ncbi:Retrovirus Polyprotein [Phytophthora palmivora]|uniref:Retrovirus Polyprotein n=1 Tax=Phytophthora palmivora TaxID=4796 RepID=A0A2P4YUV8_9STRA|nr:Retrovirus Polyprotein [Phytophthora palmivora]
MKSRGNIAVKIQLTEFGENRKIQWNCAVADQLPYAMIIGRDLIQHLGFVLDFNAGEITWDGVTMSMRSISSQSPGEQAQELQESSSSPPLSVIGQAEARQVEILDADYKKEPLDEQIPDYLSADEQSSLLRLLEKFDTKLLSGTVGSWTGDPYDIPTVPDPVPYHAKPYPIAHSLLGLTKREIERLEKLKIIARDESSPWASPAFVLPKANRTVRLLCDSRRLNKQLVRHPWPMPKINELFRNIPRFVFVTVLDLNMGYYAIHLAHRSSLLTAFILPFGKYRWLRLPMGISTAPDHFQARIDRLLGDLPFVRCYLDDVLIITETDFNDHLQHLEVVLRRLEDAGLTTNVKKCKFAEQEANFLGYRLTTDGIAPQPEKVAAIQRLSATMSKKELCRFIGLVNYYRDVWPQRAHLMAPLTQLTSKLVPWTWTAEHQAAFDKLKASIQRSTLLHYPDYEQPFEIFTDASSYQLGGIVSQAGKPLAFYSRKLTSAQKNYSVMEQELLSIVEILKEFRTMPFDQRITVYTDHKNLSCANFSSGRVMRWRLIIEEFGPTIKYIKGADNTVADALSRLPQDDNGAECNVLTEEIYPLNYSHITQYQSEDETLQAAAVQYPRKFQTKTFGVHKVLLSKAGQVIIPSPLRTAVLDFYHTALLHPGMNRMFLTMSNSVYWPGMRRAVESYVRVCPMCQTWKRSPNQYGLLPEKRHGREPWSDIAVDEIGPYSYSDEPSAPKLYALTMIDLTTNWIEIAPVKDQGAKAASLALDEFWFCRYPRPLRVIHDQGKEFVGKEFQEMLESYGVHVAFAIRATVHTILKASPAQLVFQRDMITDSLFTANWATIYSRRQRQTRRDNERESRARHDHDYRIGTKVLVVKDIRKLPKLAQPTEGPYTVTAVHSNGTLTINRGRYEETINQRRVKPFFEADQA